MCQVPTGAFWEVAVPGFLFYSAVIYVQALQYVFTPGSMDFLIRLFNFCLLESSSRFHTHSKMEFSVGHGDHIDLYSCYFLFVVRM